MLVPFVVQVTLLSLLYHTTTLPFSFLEAILYRADDLAHPLLAPLFTLQTHSSELQPDRIKFVHHAIGKSETVRSREAFARATCVE